MNLRYVDHQIDDQVLDYNPMGKFEFLTIEVTSSVAPRVQPHIEYQLVDSRVQYASLSPQSEGEFLIRARESEVLRATDRSMPSQIEDRPQFDVFSTSDLEHV